MATAYLLGHPVAHSLSPAMHNAAFKALGLPHLYEVRDVEPERLGDVVDALRADDVLGANVTIPHKEAALRLVDELAAEARRIGAVNTIVRRSSRLVGDNTDAYGFAQSLAAARVDVTGKDVMVLGAGGAARAAVVALGAARSVIVAARRLDRARLSARSRVRFATETSTPARRSSTTHARAAPPAPSTRARRALIDASSSARPKP